MTDFDRSMEGNTCLITGGTSGIGLVTVRELARQGAQVVFVGRRRERSEKVAQSIRQQTANPHVEFLLADLSSQKEVRRLAQSYRKQYSRLDVLINNAGAMFAYREETEEGIEKTLALNHLAYFLLTNQLLDFIQASAPARIINVSSHAHESVQGFPFDDPQAAKGGFWGYRQSRWVNLLSTLLAPMRHPGYLQYARTKLANLLFTYELARKLEGKGVTVNAVHPGFVASQFMAGNGSLGWFMRRWVKVFGIAPEEGAKTTIYLATSREVEGITEKYFVNSESVSTSSSSMDQEAARKLWLMSEEMTTIPRGT